MDNSATHQSLDTQGGYPGWLNNFVEVYQQLSTDNLDLLERIYHSDVLFEDPMHKVHGYQNLNQYFATLYSNLSACTFRINEVIPGDEQAAIYWQMQFSHPKLNGGDSVSVDGHSHIKQAQGKVIYHRDYLDVGAMLYEHIPVVGRIIKAIKQRAGQ
ncbi:nuclear transport factor 2 family protein [Thalassotalea sp. Y01]|uniref:nuclear transport factor 2 family protein n=1 Tax=Thalassotalea sp. Y01 TaxID=2729613 RepID=UPI00145F969B|nr:nuclear transport factor 2 family protein [Thalassotalea sp. Y01]NMP15086.1 nuclear transport factor 2 family protein [Thalassotalea sp. Y01]